MIRPPAVAGSFYPSAPDELRAELERCLPRSVPRKPAVAILVPHAGYIYSGPCAGEVFASVEIPPRVVVLCPNHTGLGAPLAIMSEGGWQTPLGTVPVDGELARRLRTEDPEIEEDDLAHRREHSLEVQLPFLQSLRSGIRFVPLCVGTQDTPALLRLGDALARTLKAERSPVLVVISSDMSHYIPAEEARRLDRKAIDEMERLEPEGLQDVVRREGITMCGIAPAVAGLRAARGLGAAAGRLVAYTNSGERTGDASQVVAYAGLVFR